MQLKLGSNKMLLLIIGVLVIYLIFKNNTSGYVSGDAYNEGKKDARNNIAKKDLSSFVKSHANVKKVETYYNTYVKGWDEVKNKTKKNLSKK